MPESLDIRSENIRLRYLCTRCRTETLIELTSMHSNDPRPQCAKCRKTLYFLGARLRKPKTTGGYAMLKFTPFDPDFKRVRHVRPPKMRVGEVVVRHKPLSCGTMIYLREDMRLCIEKGMAFSVAEDSKTYAIRRDK